MATIEISAHQNFLPFLGQNFSLTRKSLLDPLHSRGKGILERTFLEDLKSDLLARLSLKPEDMNVGQRKKFHYSMSNFLKELRRKWTSRYVHKTYRVLVNHHNQFLDLNVPYLEELKTIRNAKAAGQTPLPEETPPTPPLEPIKKVPEPMKPFSELSKVGQRKRSKRLEKHFDEDCILFTAKNIINRRGGKKSKLIFERLVEDPNAGKEMSAKLAKPDIVKVSGPEATSLVVQNDFSRSDYWVVRDTNIEHKAPIYPSWDVIQVSFS